MHAWEWTLVGRMGLASALGVEISGDAASRVIQGVAAGIGFLGAGLIFRREQTTVIGLTTAAAVWATAAVGVLCGAGAYVAAAAGTALVALILLLDKLPAIRRVEPRRLREDGDTSTPDED